MNSNIKSDKKKCDKSNLEKNINLSKKATYLYMFQKAYDAYFYNLEKQFHVIDIQIYFEFFTHHFEI